MTRGAPMLPQFVRDLLASPPRRGQGLNLWFYRVARVLHPYRDSAEIIELLEAATAERAVLVRGEDSRRAPARHLLSESPDAGGVASWYQQEGFPARPAP